MAADNRSIAFAGNVSDRTWDESSAPTAGQIVLWAFLASITMLFAGFTSAILVRRTATDWQPIAAPGLLWLNSALLLASSFTMERVRTLARQGRWPASRTWLLATTALGVLFLTGQIGAWRELAARGVYMASNPHSSFFYILTGAHAVHLMGGLLALAWLLARVWRGPSGSSPQAALKLCATYWHFLDGLWIYLFVVLFML